LTLGCAGNAATGQTASRCPSSITSGPVVSMSKSRPCSLIVGDRSACEASVGAPTALRSWVGLWRVALAWPGVNGGRNPPLNGAGCFPGTIFEQRASKKSRSGVKGKRSLAKRILDAAKGQKAGAGCDLGRAHKSAFSPPFNGGFASPLTPGNGAPLWLRYGVCHGARPSRLCLFSHSLRLRMFERIWLLVEPTPPRQRTYGQGADFKSEPIRFPS
jgi:hypothetical protein